MHHYTAFGLRWASNRPIPRLPISQSDEPRDIQVWQEQCPNIGHDAEPFPPPGTARDPVASHCQAVRFPSSGIFRLTYDDGCEFHVNTTGTEIWTTWPPEMTVEDMAVYLLGPVIGFALRLRGVIALHASSVLIDDVAIGLVGPAGAGKSTTAAAFALRGFPVLADDVSALDQIAGSYFVRPGYPHLRLWPRSVEILYGDANALMPITPSWDKRDLPLAVLEQFHNQPARLAALYVLEERSDAASAPSIEPLQGGQRLLALVANTYRNDLIDAQNRAAEFEALAPLVQRVRMRRVVPHRDQQRLDALCELLVDDVRQLAAQSGGPNGGSWLPRN